jgi:molybdopterin converting factor subunit 1
MSGPSPSAGTVRVRVLFFARARELAATSSTELEIPAVTTPADALRCFVLPRYPALQPLAPHCALAVNLEYVGDDEKCLCDGDELAVIPPISGG